jgi:hypothetical protein
MDWDCGFHLSTHLGTPPPFTLLRMEAHLMIYRFSNGIYIYIKIHLLPIRNLVIVHNPPLKKRVSIGVYASGC